MYWAECIGICFVSLEMTKKLADPKSIAWENSNDTGFRCNLTL
jgi:hypothetical protein